MDTKLVVRVLDAENNLLAWAEVWAHAKGDGCLWAEGNYPALVEMAGTPAVLSIHWADINTEIRQPFASKPVVPGQTIVLTWTNTPVITVGPAAGGLPPVIVRSAVVISPAPGVFGARGN